MRTSTERVQKHREALRHSGLRPVQIWVPDTRAEKFADECRKQSKLAANHDVNDPGLDRLLAESIDDIDGWDS